MSANDLQRREPYGFPIWSPEAATAQAIEIGERVSSHAIGSNNRMGGHADDTGIGLFLLALARKTGRTDFHAIGLATFAPLHDRLTTRAAPDGAVRVLGGLQGRTSSLYPLVAAAALGDCPDLLLCAEQLAQQLTPDLIETDRQFDLAAGAAGAILGLLALHEAGRPIGLEKAVACGQHLLAHVPPPSGRTNPIQSAGLARGAAGFALALARLGRASAQARFADAAASWAAYENALFDRTHGNWPERRLPSDVQPDMAFARCSWCHGATGIGFARLGMCSPAALDMKRAIRRTITEPLSDDDSLCHGNFGRISFLLEAGLRLGRPELIAQARARAAQRLASACMPGDDARTPGFFSGASGVGYELLRLADPHLVPCALLWDAAVARVATPFGGKQCG
jgi:lantibiotic modifying enzyme